MATGMIEEPTFAEGVKKFTLLPADWPPAGDELTPTMKLRRKPIATQYQKAIEAMYEEQR